MRDDTRCELAAFGGFGNGCGSVIGLLQEACGTTFTLGSESGLARFLLRMKTIRNVMSARHTKPPTTAPTEI